MELDAPALTWGPRRLVTRMITSSTFVFVIFDLEHAIQEARRHLLQRKLARTFDHLEEALVDLPHAATDERTTIAVFPGSRSTGRAIRC